MPGHLFTDYFLTDGIRQTPERRAQGPAFAAFRDAARRLVQDFAGYRNPNEAQTEQDLIRPLLQLLGWTDDLPQQGAGRGEDIPDLLLFADAPAKARAAAVSGDDRYLEALAVVESKRFRRPLDTRGRDGGRRASSPHAQVLRYLATADAVSDGRLRWGILTNGAVWRLYDQQTRPRATAFYQADLQALLGDDDDGGLRTFHLLFRRESFLSRPGARDPFLQVALDQGRRYEQRVAQSLAGVVFQRVFPSLLQALADAADAPMPQVRHAALIFLYRLLFVLYAEDRGLLPVDDSRYDDYGLRQRVRDDIARRKARNDTFSSAASSYYDHLTTLFRLIDRGDPSIGLPPYNGGLFAHDAAPLLNRVRLPDAVIAPIVHRLSHTQTDDRPGYVNYRDMSVQQLGSIYEQLLEKEPVLDAQGKVHVRPNPYARKDSGSFYTPQDLVDLIVDQTLEPLIEERLNAFETRANELQRDRRPKAERRADLARLDPAQAVLDLKVLDPAMGSGHFLVTAVDVLTDAIADLIEFAPAVAGWLPDDAPYRSPLLDRIAAIRADILRRAKDAGWTVNEQQLTDQAIVRRLVLKRCIYGVDKNPLTVELAKVSLWLHSFTVGAPLSFLDHHLRCGDSLLGLQVLEAHQDFERLGGLSASSAVAAAEAATTGMQRIERLADADVTEVRQSAGLFAQVEQATAQLRGVLDFLCGLRWQTSGLKQRARRSLDGLLAETLGRQPDAAFDLLARGPDAATDGSTDRDDTWRQFSDRWTEARRIADREGFLHWEVAFPGVWRRWQNYRPDGGFDAVIGNPPWDLIEQPATEWFALRGDQSAWPGRGSERTRLIERRILTGDKLAIEFESVRLRAASLRAYARLKESYPLLSGGRTNLYSLFVERAMQLLRPDGIAGLLTPSGIYADDSAVEFFRSISTGGRVKAVFDFENRRLGTGLPPFFPDVDSRFKFCALVFGGNQRKFEKVSCAYFLSDTAAIDDPEICFELTPADFARVNPNTGTSPVFRTRRDAHIVSDIYARHPVIVNRSGERERKVWPLRHIRGMFNLTTDFELFRTADQLNHQGFYPVHENRWRRGEELYLPLYQGRVIHQFDHRANSIRFNPNSTHNPYSSEEISDEQHQDPSFRPRPHLWAPSDAVEAIVPMPRGWSFGFRDVARPTDARTIVASITPWVGSDLGIRLILPTSDSFDAFAASCLLANFNSFAFDFVARQKIQGTHASWYIVEQLPVVAPDSYQRLLGDHTAADLVRDHVLRLTYTSHDMAPFARDLGYDDDPFPWDPEHRRHLRARLDALYFHFYGLDRDATAYILSTFPIIQRQDQAQFGHYRTKSLILAYMNALAAGDTESQVTV